MLTDLPKTSSAELAIIAWALSLLFIAYHLPGLKHLFAYALEKLYEILILKNTVL